MVEVDPSHTGGSLIAASKVNGTTVYNTVGEKLGSVYDVMIDKRSGKAAYAIMSFGGFLGIGDSYHPLPWQSLTYDDRQGGYVVNIDRSRLGRCTVIQILNPIPTDGTIPATAAKLTAIMELTAHFEHQSDPLKKPVAWADPYLNCAVAQPSRERTTIAVKSSDALVLHFLQDVSYA